MSKLNTSTMIMYVILIVGTIIGFVHSAMQRVGDQQEAVDLALQNLNIQIDIVKAQLSTLPEHFNEIGLPNAEEDHFVRLSSSAKENLDKVDDLYKKLLSKQKEVKERSSSFYGQLFYIILGHDEFETTQRSVAGSSLLLNECLYDINLAHKEIRKQRQDLLTKPQ